MNKPMITLNAATALRFLGCAAICSAVLAASGADARRDQAQNFGIESDSAPILAVYAPQRTLRLGVGGDIVPGAVGIGAVIADEIAQMRHALDDAAFVDPASMPVDHIAKPMGTPESERPVPTVPRQIDNFEHSLALTEALAETAQVQATINQVRGAPWRKRDRLAVAGGRAELTCLAEAIYYEARSEPINGQIAVGEVILNRVASKHYPNSVCGVVTQGADRLHRCQFSYKCDGKPERLSERKAFKRAHDIATMLLKGEDRRITKGATHYHADYVSPGWAKTLDKTASIGQHIFFR